ncbi:MAG: thiamine pyrophosphate-binding protein [Alphaproteobacteria bacterium]
MGNPTDGPAPVSPVLATAIVDQLKAVGVRRMFGIPGGGSSLNLIEAAGRAGLEFILTRTETTAAIMAAVTGELTGIPGVVLTGIGPGAASAVNGIAYAWLEKSPVILITDGPASSPHQAFGQNALFAPVTKLQGRLRPENGAADFARAIEVAMTPPWGPVQLDLTAGDASTPVAAAAPPAPAPPPPAAPAAALSKAGTLLSASRRPIILAGLEARHGRAPGALGQMADALGCPVLTTYKASGILPASHPGLAGLFTGATAEADLIHAADLILLFGLDPIEIIPSRWPYQSPVLDLCPAVAAPLAVEPACRLIGDLEAIANALAPDLTRSDWTIGEIDAARRTMAGKLALSGFGHTAQTTVEATVRAAPAGSRLTVDAGAHMFSTLAAWPAGEPFGVLKSNGLSTMGYALPAAIASALEEPTRHVVALTGDGGILMCLAELTTAVALGCRLTVIVINDAALSLIDVKQQRQQNRSLGVRYASANLAACANAMGCRAWRVEPGDDIAPVLGAAFAVDGPSLIDVVANADGYGDQLTRLRG